MISHFSLSGCDNSLYFAIASIRLAAKGLLVSGTVGDGSAEAWFEARVGEKLQVSVLPVWEADSDSLCRRYDQAQLEYALTDCFQDVDFHSEGTFDRDSGLWQQQIVALPKRPGPLPGQPPRQGRPHQVAESGPAWQHQLAH